MDLVLSLGLAALPAIILLWLVYRQDRARPEPFGLVGKGVLYGVVAVVPAIAAESVLDAFTPGGILGAAFRAFIVAALVEESVKYFFIKRMLFRRPAFDECMDGIVYAVCVSLGFAFVENVAYGLRDRSVLLLRAFTAVPMHAIAAGIMGYYIGRAKVTRDGNGAALCATGLGRAVVIHGLYDFFLFVGGGLAFAAIGVLFVGGLTVRGLMRDAREIDLALRGSPKESL